MKIVLSKTPIEVKYGAQFDKATVTIAAELETLDDLLENMEVFARACGFVFTGTLAIVNEDDPMPPTEDETSGAW